MLIPERSRQQAKHKVVIAGCVYHLISDEPEHIIKAAAARIDSMIHSAMEESGCHDVAKIAVLVALRLARAHDIGQLRLSSLITDHIDQVV
jgi:hypothetical protein